MDKLLVRFLEYNYSEDKGNKYEGAKYITGFDVGETYDRFVNMIQSLVGHDVMLKEEWYTIDDYIFCYGGAEEDAVCFDVYCVGY